MNYIKLNKELLHIIKIPDILYSMYGLRKALMKKLNKKTYGSYYISNELQTFLNESKDYVLLEQLISIIILNYSENTDKPTSDYYSYDQKPNYNLVI